MMPVPLARALRVLTVVCPALLMSGPGAQARDHDAVRQAVERGEIRALADILNGLSGKLPGDIVGVEIEQKNGRWLYEFRAVDGNGRLYEIYVDARSGAIERIKEK